MRHRVKGKKLGRTSAHRLSLYRNLATDLFTYGHIETTLAKAKAVRPFSEKLITKARQQSLAKRRELLATVNTGQAFSNLWTKIASVYSNRSGGYTRIIKLGWRSGDRAPMARLELVGNPLEEKEPRSHVKH